MIAIIASVHSKNLHKLKGLEKRNLVEAEVAGRKIKCNTVCLPFNPPLEGTERPTFQAKPFCINSSYTKRTSNRFSSFPYAKNQGATVVDILSLQRSRLSVAY